MTFPPVSIKIEIENSKTVVNGNQRTIHFKAIFPEATAQINDLVGQCLKNGIKPIEEYLEKGVREYCEQGVTVIQLGINNLNDPTNKQISKQEKRGRPKTKPKILQPIDEKSNSNFPESAQPNSAGEILGLSV